MTADDEMARDVRPSTPYTREREARAAAAEQARATRNAGTLWVRSAATRLGVTEGTVRRWIRTGRLNPVCRDIYASVFPYLDRELSDVERRAVDRHIAACPGCEAHFEFDGTVLRFVRQRTPRPEPPPGLEERLLAPFRGRAAPDG